MQNTTDRHLLFGILALQNNFISRDQLVAAFGQWIADKSQSISSILVANGALTAQLAKLLEQLLEEHLTVRAQSVQASLMSLSSVASVRADLTKINDADLQRAVAQLSDVRAEDSYSTQVGESTSQGYRFEIRRPLGKGGLGVVSVAYDHELNREVALKEIRTDRASDDETRRRFVVEAEVTGNLEHPGIVPVYGLGCYPDGRPYYAMRFVQGDNLAVHIREFHASLKSRQQTFDGSKLRSLLRRFLDICDAVSYAHSRGVLHRDLKPGNIMIGRYGETLVVDWGLAKTQGVSGDSLPESSTGPVIPILADSEQTRMGSVMGTPAYAPPEQLQGQITHTDQRSDIYGLGAILYELLCGFPPVSGMSIGEAITAICNGRIESPRARLPLVPVALDRICVQAMALRREDRYQTAKDLMADIEAWLDDLPVAASPDTVSDRLARWFRRNRAAALATSLGLAGIAAVSLVALLVTNQARQAANSAREIAYQEQRTALEQKRVAEQQRDRGDLYFAQARDAVDRFLTTVSDDPQLKRPDFLSLRRSLLNSALEYYQEFDKSSIDDRLLVRERAVENSRKLASIYLALGQPSASLKILDAASKSFAAADAVETKPEARNLLGQAELQYMRANALHATGNFEQARQVVDVLLDDLKSMASDTADDKMIRLMADARELAGSIANAQLDHNAEERDLTEALTLRQQLYDRQTSTINLVDLARSRSLLAAELAEQRRFDEAITSANKSVEQLSGIDLRSNPEVATTVMGLQADLHQLSATLYRVSGSPENALKQFQKAKEAREELLNLSRVPKLYADLAKSLADLTNAHMSLAALVDARASANRAVEICELLTRDYQDVAEYQLLLADSLHRLAQAQDDSQQAIQLLNRSQQALQKVLEDKTVRAGAALLWLEILNSRGRTYRKGKQMAKAIEEYEAGAQTAKKFLVQYPDDNQIQRLATSFTDMLGLVYYDSAAYERAIENSSAALEVFLRLLQSRPADDDLRLKVIGCRTVLLKSYIRLKQYEPAALELEPLGAELDRLKPDFLPTTVQLFRTQFFDYKFQLLLAMRKIDQAADVAIQQMEHSSKNATTVVNGCRKLASCINSLDKMAANYEEQRQRLVTICIEQLKRLPSLGFTDVEQLTKLAEFQTLQSESEYQNFIQSFK